MQAILLICALMRQVKLVFPIAAIGLCLNIPKLTPFYSHFDLPVPPSTERVRILAFNCEGEKNHNYDAICKIAKEERADIVCFSEINDAWVKKIKEKFEDFPYQTLFPKYGGIGMVSKLPFERSEIRLSTFRNRPRMLSTVTTKSGQRITVLTVRPNIPLNEPAYSGRNLDFELYAKDLQPISTAKVLIGDLNCTPWSYYYTTLCADIELKGCTNGKGPANTWSPGGLLCPLLPLDQCLISEELAATEFKVEVPAGSDHRPILVELIKNPYNFTQQIDTEQDK